MYIVTVIFPYMSQPVSDHCQELSVEEL